MKIRALRVREVGCLRQPQVLEGLSGGLDVLAGPNELGKSTLLRALDAAFSIDHTSKTKAARDWMVPDTGGAPVIEVDFDIGGAGYRLRKQYFTGAKAALTRLGDGATARGADAESQLAELLAGLGGPERLGLLWVHQTGALEDFSIEPGTAAGLKGLIERELVAAAGGQRLHVVRNKVRERLAALVTGARRQPRGAYKEAMELQARLTAEHTELRRKAAEGQAGFERLGLLRESHAALTDSAARAERAERLASARVALEAGRTAALNRRAGEETAKRLQHESAAAAAALSAFDAAARELEALTERLVSFNVRLQTAKTSADLAAQHHQAAEAGVRAANGHEQDLRERSEAAIRAQAAAVQRKVLAKRLSEARELDAQAAGLKAEIAANPASPDVLRRAEAALRGIEIAGAKAVRIAIAYEPGAAGRIAKDGQPVAADTAFEIAGPAELVIAGIGRIRIEPAGTEPGDAAKLEAARQDLAGCLSAAGLPDIERLRLAARLRAERAAELSAATSRLAGLCPEGVENLQASLDMIADDPAAEGATAGLAAELAKVQADRANAEAALRLAQVEVQQSALAQARLETEIVSGRQRHAELTAARPSADGHRAGLLGTAAASNERAQLAMAELAAHRLREPGPEQMAGLQRELAAATAAEADASAKTRAHENEMAGLEASLKRDALDGIGERLAECEGALGAAAKRLAALSREIAALSLLEEQLQRVAADTSARYLAPMTERLAPYLAMMLPEAVLTLGQGFGPEALTRGGRSERLQRLSEGTREQVAVLVRLGLARLIAEGGEPVPLILDDALVYSDDGRIARAFAALQEAAGHHQVIVLTCRAKAFEPLGGTRLALTPWSGFAE